MTALQRLLVASSVAAVVLVTIVLPAEQGIDPVGTGSLLGITGLAAPTRSPGTADMTAPYRHVQVEIELTSFESEEIKFLMSESEVLIYSWRANDEVVFDLHAEPEDDVEAARSFSSGRSVAGNGQHVAPFRGAHGWFFENRNAETVLVTLHVAGFFERALRYRGGYPDEIAVSMVFDTIPDDDKFPDVAND